MNNKVQTVVYAAVAAMMLGAGTASAENSLRTGAAALNVRVTDVQADPVMLESNLFLLKGKYFLGDDLALLGGIGLGIKGGDASGTDFGFLAGLRKYLRREDFAPFVGGYLSYTTTQDSDFKETAFVGEFGAEYFLAKQFSVEGAARFGYTSLDTPTGNPTGDVTNLGTLGAELSVNYYF